MFIVGYYRILGLVALTSLAVSGALLWSIIAHLGTQSVGDHVAVAQQFSSPYPARLTALQRALEAPGPIRQQASPSSIRDG